jgi:hypothetical protein
LRYTTGFCIGNFYARGVGTQARHVFKDIDDAVLRSWENINFQLSSTTLRQLATLPTSCGGFGLRQIAVHCGVAFIAAAISAAEHFPTILVEHVREQLSHTVDAWLTQPEDDVHIQQFPSVVDTTMRYLENGIPERNGQRKLSRELDRAMAEELKPQMAPALRARVTSAAAPHANAWMAPSPGADKPQWLNPSEWDVLIRRRLCLPVSDTEVQCGNCLRSKCDVMGNHAVACMRGPSRWTIHNTIRDAVSRVCQDALLSPVVEPTCFETNERPDVLIRFPGIGGRRSLAVVDVAMTSTHTNIRAATASPGGAATVYEANKRRKYQARADEIRADLVPLIVDDCGAWGKSALPFWRRVAARYQIRYDISNAKAMSAVMGVISSAMMGAVARAILCSVARRPSYLP